MRHLQVTWWRNLQCGREAACATCIWTDLGTLSLQVLYGWRADGQPRHHFVEAHTRCAHRRSAHVLAAHSWNGEADARPFCLQQWMCQALLSSKRFELHTCAWGHCVSSRYTDTTHAVLANMDLMVHTQEHPHVYVWLPWSNATVVACCGGCPSGQWCPHGAQTWQGDVERFWRAPTNVCGVHGAYGPLAWGVPCFGRKRGLRVMYKEHSNNMSIAMYVWQASRRPIAMP
jgi:hypothetical protein